jgi:hypothetical protein
LEGKITYNPDDAKIGNPQGQTPEIFENEKYS